MGRVTTAARKDPTSVWIFPPLVLPTAGAAAGAEEGLGVTDGFGVGDGEGLGDGEGEGEPSCAEAMEGEGDGEGDGELLPIKVFFAA